MSANPTPFIEVLNATSAGGDAWTVTVTKAKQVETAIVIPLAAAGAVSGVGLNATGATANGQVVSFSLSTTGTAQPTALTVAVVYTGS